MVGKLNEFLRKSGAFMKNAGKAAAALAPESEVVITDDEMATIFIEAVTENTKALKLLTRKIDALTEAVNDNTDIMAEEDEDEE